MKQKTSGSGLIFAVVLLFVILGMVITLASVTMLETKMNQKTKSSVGAFYNADSGVEWALNKIANPSGPNISDVFSTILPGSGVHPAGVTDYNIYLLDKDGKVITSDLTIAEVKAVRAVGTQGGDTQRAIEAAVASGGGGCYVDYSLSTGLAVGTSCGAVGGFTIKRSAGKWGYCVYGSLPNFNSYFLPPGGDCVTGYGKYDYAEAYVCCI